MSSVSSGDAITRRNSAARRRRASRRTRWWTIAADFHHERLRLCIPSSSSEQRFRMSDGGNSPTHDRTQGNHSLKFGGDITSLRTSHNLRFVVANSVTPALRHHDLSLTTPTSRPMEPSVLCRRGAAGSSVSCPRLCYDDPPRPHESGRASATEAFSPRASGPSV